MNSQLLAVLRFITAANVHGMSEEISLVPDLFCAVLQNPILFGMTMTIDSTKRFGTSYSII